MTDEHEKLLVAFEAKVRYLMFVCDTQKQKITELENALDLKEADLQQAKKMFDELNAKYSNLMMARIISVKEGEVKDAKQRLLKLVREVDKCIALLNG